MGTQKGSNSIGKSSALLAIDFVFGENTYLNSDGVKYSGSHPVYFYFEFDKKYYFVRHTGDPDTFGICDNKYEILNDSWAKKSL